MITLTVYGRPAPQGSKKAVGMLKSRKTGSEFTNMQEVSKYVKPWRKLVEAAGLAYMAKHRATKLDGPLVGLMVFTLAKPKSAPKRRQTWPDRYPDVSKLLRSTEDALSTAKVWADDARVVRYRDLRKVFPGEDEYALGEPGVYIEIETMAEYLGRLGVDS